MNKKGLTLLLTVLLGIIGLSSCKSAIYDNLAPCPLTIGFMYTYNLNDVNTFGAQAHDIQLLAFDSKGVLIYKWSEKNRNYPKNEIYYATLPIPRETTRIITISGMDDNYIPLDLKVGKTTQEELNITLKATSEMRCKAELPPLLVGDKNNIHLTGIEGEKVMIYMKKWTNTLRLLFRDQDNRNDIPIDTKNYTFEIQTADGVYNLEGKELKPETMHYLPYVDHANGNGSGAVVEFTTLRILQDKPYKLRIVRKSDNHELINVDLIPLLQDTRLHRYSEFTYPEYLDRQDEYEIVFLAKTKDFIAFHIMVDKWMIREFEAHL